MPAYAAPARADDLSGLPPTLVTVGDVDGLRDEAIDFADRLDLAGVATERRVYEGGVHSFATLAPRAAIAQRFRSDQRAWLARHLGLRD